MKKSKTTLEKERLMKEVLGKRSYGDIDIKTFEEEIKKDFGITYKKPIKDNKLIFDNALKELKVNIIGQDEALNKLCLAFRRPYVINNVNYKNAMIVYGNEGVGKHMAITQLAKLLSKDDIVKSYDVYNLDMSTYTSSSQELLFLQDLFSAINGRGSIICFENFKLLCGALSFSSLAISMTSSTSLLFNSSLYLLTILSFFNKLNAFNKKSFLLSALIFSNI